MNRVFEHAGDLVNIKVEHNLMRLIAEGFGEDDNTADSQLRLSAVESYLGLIGKPKLPSTFLQVICWVLGEYGTAWGKYSASYITGKLCDVAEAYSTDDTVKAYAVAALMKIYAFEIAAGRPVDMLPECRSLIEQLSASHSSDLQQRTYELQAVLGLDSQSIEIILPFDASCEDIEVDKDLSFLNSYVEQTLEKGAQPYIPEDIRSGISGINIRSQGHHEPSSHGLRFEAYELPNPIIQPKPTPISHVPSTELVPVFEPYMRETHQPASLGSAAHSGSSEIKLRLDGVQKKWGTPSYSSPTPSSTSTSSSHNSVSGVSKHDGAASLSSKARDSSYGVHKKQEIDPEKQKLAASLFGGISKTEKRASTSSSHKPTKPASRAVDRSQETKSVVEKTPAPPPPDLLDLGEPVDKGSNSSSLIDPFKQLEGLLETGQGESNVNSSSYKTSTRETELMALYEDITMSGKSGSMDINKDVDLLFGSSNDVVDMNGHGAGTIAPASQGLKGPNLKDALQKNSLVRQMGVTPTTQNPTLFKDLLG